MKKPRNHTQLGEIFYRGAAKSIQKYTFSCLSEANRQDPHTFLTNLEVFFFFFSFSFLRVT